MQINKKILYIIIAISVIIFGYFTVTISENDYKSSKNIDKYITVHSVTYIPNGRESALCQMECFDKIGIEYHITNTDRHFVGDVIKYYEHHGRVFIYLINICGLFLISLMIGMIVIIVLMILNSKIV